MSRTPDRAIDRRGVLALGAAFTATAAGALSGDQQRDGMLAGPGEHFTNTLPWRDGLTDARLVTQGSRPAGPMVGWSPAAPFRNLVA